MKRPLKVLSIGHSYVVGLNRAILREVAKDKNYDVTVASPSLFKGSLRFIQAEPEPVSSQLKLETIDAYMTRKMHIFAYDHFQLKKLMAQKFDVVHAWEEPYIFAGFQVARMANKYNTNYAFRTAQSLVKDYVYPFRYFEKKCLEWAKAWIAGGHLVQKAMLDKGWPAEKSNILTLAVDSDRFQPFSEEEKQFTRKRLNLKGPVIGYLGRLSEEKGCDLFMEVLGKLKHYPWSFLVMGSGPYKQKIEAWAKKEGIASRVKVQLFSHDEITKVLPVCDLLICPSQTREFWKEQFGRMLIEAFASGVPVIASDSGEIPRVVGQGGLILPEADADSWEKSIESFLLDPTSMENYRERAQERVNLYTAKTLAEQYKVFYSQLYGEKKQ